MPLTFDILQLQNAETSNAVIEVLSQDSDFLELSKKETAMILQRDQEDDSKLAEGIQLAIEKGVIPKDVDVEKINKIDVMGKSSDEVVNEIIDLLGEHAKKGCVLVLQGLSGTGKGTTVAKLKQALPRATTWSNGNVFRSLTLLAATYAEQKGVPLSDSLTPENLDTFVKMLSFGKHNGKFDVKIDGLGIDAVVSEIENTTLKEPKVAKNIPTVAGVTQGEVINFVQGALQQMADDGMSVLVEGRAQTLNYIRTPFRFELILSDELIIGKRRAAQRLMAAALKKTRKGWRK